MGTGISYATGTVEKSNITDGGTYSAYGDIDENNKRGDVNGGVVSVTTGTLNVLADTIMHSVKIDGATARNGGVLYVSGTGAYLNVGNNVTFNDNGTTGNGGAIYLNTQNSTNVTFGTGLAFSNNKSKGSNGGGAVYVYNKNTEITFTDTSFTNNVASSNGGAIWTQGTVNIEAVDSNVVFSGNKSNATIADDYTVSGGNPNDIHFYGGNGVVNFDASADKTISLGGGITNSNEDATINKDGAGTLELAMAGPVAFTGKVYINDGTLKTNNKGSGTANTLFINAKQLNFADGTKISTQNNAIETTDLGKITLNGDVYAMLDVDLSNGTIDNFTTSKTISDNGHKILIGISNLNALDGSLAATINATVADESTRDYVALSADTSGILCSRNYNISYTPSNGVLTFTGGSTLDLWSVLNESPSDAQTIYLLAEDYTTPAGKSSLGSISGQSFNLKGNGYVINGDDKRGLSIGPGKQMTINNTTFQNFSSNSISAIYNLGELTLSNVTFGDSTDPAKGNSINRSESQAYDIDIAITGGGAISNVNHANITSITGTNFYSNSVVAQAIVTSGTGNAEAYNSGGGAILNYFSEIGAINGDFTSNSVRISTNSYSGIADSSWSGGGAIFNNYKIGDISGNFYGNSAVSYATSPTRAVLVSTGGGALFNLGTINSITDSSFTNNKTNRDGGAILNHTNSIQVMLVDEEYGSVDDMVAGLGYSSIEAMLAGEGYSSLQEMAEDWDGTGFGEITNGITDTSFTGNTAAGKGGAIYSSGDLVINAVNDSVVFNNNKQGVEYTYDGEGNITGIVADTGTLNDIYMDAEYMDDAVTLTLNSADADHTITLNGGIDGKNYKVLINDAGKVIFGAGTINGSNGVDVQNGTLEVNGTTFTNNVNKTGNGGAIYNRSGATISSITGNFTGNSATDKGGAIWNNGTIGDTTDPTKTAISGNFISNTAGSGGAIRNSNIITKIADATFGSATDTVKGNTASEGGAIQNYSGTIKSLSADFYYNKATNGDGGALYNWGTIGDATDPTKTAISGNFIGNTATGSGGAIRNYSTITKIADTTFGSSTDNIKGNTAARGGAISNNGTINSLSADFYYNKATDGDGGAINNYGTIGTLTGNFTGNSATDRGGAIYNYGTLTVKTSDTADITFSGNTDSTGSNAIHNASGTVTFDGTKNIVMNDKLSGTTSGNYVKQGTGALVLKNDMSGVNGNVQLNGGTVQLTNNGLIHGTFFSNANSTTFGTGTTTKIDAQNTYTETINLGKNVALDGNINLYMDVDLSGTSDVSDKIVAWDDVNNVAGTVTGDGKIYINTINPGVLENIRLTSDVDAPVDGSAISRTIASTNLANHLVVATDARVGLENSTEKWILTYDGDTGILSFNNGWTLPEAIASTADSVIYNAILNEPTLTADLGNLGGITTSVRMNGKTVDGGGHAGVNVVTTGQELGIQNAVFTNFSKTGAGDGGVVNNINGTVTIENVTIHDASATGSGGAVMNNTEGSLTISGSEFYDNESGYDGGAIYNGGSTFTISGTSSVHDNTANGNGGGIYVINQSANISGTTFTSNSAKKRGGTDGGDGGAYYAMNATTTMNNVTFESNTAENSAGAFANAGGTSTLTNATFTSNTASGMAGALYNVGGGTTTVNKGTFTSNSSTGAFGGGAIFNDGDNSKVEIKNTGNSFTSNFATQGGAISNYGKQIDVSKATFNGNKAISQGGGAILNNGEYREGKLYITDSSFTNNLAANQGGAISNIGNATKSIVKITASGADITFSGNKQGIVFNPDGTINDDSGAVSNAIYNEGTVEFAGSKTITLNDSITGTANSVYTQNGTGTLVLANDMSGVLGDVILKKGTVKIVSGGNFFSSDTTRAKKVEVAGSGVVLDVKNGDIETVDLGNLALEKDLKIAIDVDLSKTGTEAIDNFKTTGTITGTKNIIIDTIDANNIIYMHAINDLAASDYPQPSASEDSTEYQGRKVVTKIADASIADKFKLASHISLDTREVIDGSTHNHDSSGTTGLGWFMYYNNTTGELSFIDQSLRATLKDESDDTKVYIMAADEVVEGHLNNILGTAGDTSTNTTVQIAGQDNKIFGNGFKGVIVESGQKFIVEKVSEASGFAKSSDNGSFINVKAGGEAYITDSTIKSNSVNNAQGGAVYVNTGNLVLGGATFDSNSATKTGSSGGSGGAIYNYQGTISEATGASQSTFTGNSAAVNGGAIGNVGSSNTEKAIIESLNAQFTNNSAASNGGAIYNRLGDINSLTGTFTSNTADNGGAIYNYSGTINLNNTTFIDNGATTAGGAINNATSTATINMSDVNFEAPTGTNKNDIYNVGTINVMGGTTSNPNKFASDITNTGSIDFGGTNTISASINTTATGSNKINFTGTNELTSTVIMSGDMPLTNSGDLTLNNDLSRYTGKYTQTAGSTDVKSTATLFGGENIVQGGTMALDGTLASSLDVQGGTVTSKGTFASGSATSVNGGTLTMNGGELESGSTIRVYSGTMNYQSGSVNGDLKVKGGNLNVQNDLTIQGDSYIRDAASTTIDSGKTLTVQNLNPANTTGVQLNSNDNWNGNVNVGTDGILSVTDIVNGSLTQTAGTSTFNNAVLDMANANISGGDVNLASQSVLNYVSGTTFSPENLNLSGSSTMQMMNNIAGETLTLNNVSTDGTNNIKLDINPNAGKFDTVAINGDLTGTNSGALYVSDFNYIGGTPTEKDYKFQLFDISGTTSNVDFLSSDKEFKSAIGNYRIISNGGGAYTFGLTSYNPQVYRGQVATMAAYNNQINIDNIILDQFVLQNSVSPTDKTANRYASAQSLFSPYQHTPEEGGLWYKSYVDFETLSFTHGLKSHNTAYGALVGADLPMMHLKHGWDYIPTFYVGYNGATQDFNNVTMYQNGGQGGYMGTFIHKDFIGSIMAYAGGYNNQMKVNGENDNTGNWFAGTASKLAYNFHPTKHFIIQPTAFISYNIFGKQHWNSDFGAVGMNSGLLNGINVAPGLNLIYKRDTWSVYATFQYMYNINEQVSGRAANIDIPSLKMRHGYFQYGIGATKTWKDRLASYFQFNIRNGGRTGVGFQLGLRYSFDWKLKSKSKNQSQKQTSSPQRRVLKG